MWKRTIDFNFYDLDFVSNEVGKVKVLRVLKIMEHDSGACIYGTLMNVDTNDILLNNEFPILDVGKKIITKDNGEETIKLNRFELINDVVAKCEREFNVSSFMNEAISKGFEGDFSIVWSTPSVMNFKGIGVQNPSYFEKSKDLRPALYDEKVIGLGYTPMFLIHSDEALEIEKFKISRENKIEFAYDYGNLNSSYWNEKINFKDDFFQEIINPYFEKIDSPFQQTSSLKPYVLM
nr:hypothetical protein [Tanacetum cinerariifolium]